MGYACSKHSRINLFIETSVGHNTVYKLALVLGQILTTEMDRCLTCRGARLTVSTNNVPQKISSNSNISAHL